MFFILIFLLCLNLVNATLNYDPYDSFEVKKRVSYANVFSELIEQSSGKYDMSENVLKSIFGIFTDGNLGEVTNYNYEGRIGVMGLIPFSNEEQGGQDYHYSDCLESKCMGITVSEDLSLQEKREKVKSDYINIENSVCCAAYLLGKNYKQIVDKELVFPKSNSECYSAREQVTYTDWKTVVRRFIGESCTDNQKSDVDYMYFIERYSQLYEAFNKYDYSNYKSYGILKFTPSFSIKAPELIDVYDDIMKFVNDTMKNCNGDPTETCVENQQQKFMNNHENMSFINYCEEPKVNVINSIYDRIVNAYETEEDNCKYLIASQYPKLPNGNITFINISSDGQKPEVKIYNSLKEYNFYPRDDRFNGVRFLKIEGHTNNLSYKFKNKFPLNNFIGDFRNIYLLKNSSLSSNDFLFVFEGQMGDFYNMLNTKINVSAYPTCKNKYKYFTCLDTNMTEQVFDWVSWSWKESAETIKIKFAFEIPNNP